MSGAPARVWGEDAHLLAAAGPDVDALAVLEDGVGRGAGLPAGPRADAHVHLGTDADGHHLDPGALVADMDRWGIGVSVCFPANEPGPDGDFRPANAAVLAAAARHAGRLVPFCRVDPGRGAEGALRAAAEGGARGLKLHPVAQRFRPEAPEAVECVRIATGLGWPVLLHAGFGARPLAGPLASLLDAVPDARLILAHGGRGDARAVREALAGHPGVWFDTSLAALPDLAALPPQRVLLGTDRPYGEHATALALVGQAARAADWDERAVHGVLAANLAALLGEPAVAGEPAPAQPHAPGPPAVTLMFPADAVRLAAALGAVEMALVRRDAVCGPLLAQAARAADGLPPGPLLAASHRASRAADLAGASPAEAAARKAVQAMCRAAAQAVQAALLAPRG